MYLMALCICIWIRYIRILRILNNLIHKLYVHKIGCIWEEKLQLKQGLQSFASLQEGKKADM